MPLSSVTWNDECTREMVQFIVLLCLIWKAANSFNNCFAFHQKYSNDDCNISILFNKLSIILLFMFYRGLTKYSCSERRLQSKLIVSISAATYDLNMTLWSQIKFRQSNVLFVIYYSAFVDLSTSNKMLLNGLIILICITNVTHSPSISFNHYMRFHMNTLLTFTLVLSFSFCQIYVFLWCSLLETIFVIIVCYLVLFSSSMSKSSIVPGKEHLTWNSIWSGTVHLF